MPTLPLKRCWIPSALNVRKLLIAGPLRVSRPSVESLLNCRVGFPPGPIGPLPGILGRNGVAFNRVEYAPLGVR